MSVLKRRWILIPVFFAIVPLSFVTFHALNQAEKEFKESKWVRTTSGTVLRKELEMKNGETQKRIYFQIDNFDQVDDARRTKAVEREKGLVGKYGPRSTLDVDWY